LCHLVLISPLPFSLSAITHQLQWFSGTSIRNGACLGGNIVTASPISDLNPVFIALNAQFRLMSFEGGERVVSASDFFLPGYRQVRRMMREATSITQVFFKKNICVFVW